MNAKAQPKQQPQKQDPLNVLFPEEKVDLIDGTFITVKPPSLEHYPKIFKHFSVVLSYFAQGYSMSEVGMVAMAELTAIIPYCIDRPANQVPHTAVPDLIDIVLRQNLTEELVGKWQSLIEKIKEEGKEGVIGQALSKVSQDS